jgi:hypothetical protein
MASAIYANGQAEVTVPNGDKLAIYSLSSLKLYKQVGYPQLPDAWLLEKTTIDGETYTTAAVSGATIYRVEASAAVAYYETGAAPSISEPQTDITAADATFTINGLAAAQGGYVAATGGTSSTAANAGGAVSMTGGVPGVTGVGGAATVAAGAGGATSGAGGVASLVGGAGTNGNANGGNVVLDAGAANGSGVSGHVIARDILVQPQGAPSAKTTTAATTIAELKSGIITITHAVGGNQDYALPAGAAIDAAMQLSAGDSFQWSVLNLSSAEADIATLTSPGADHTLVGAPIIRSAHAASGLLYGNSARFLTRKTAANTFISYRIA